MAGMIYLSVRLFCIAYLLYKVWQQKGRIRKLCDLIYTPVKREEPEIVSPTFADEADVIGKTRFVYLDENAGKTIAPYMCQPLETSKDYIGEEEKISSEEVDCTLSPEEMVALREAQEEMDESQPETDAVSQTVTLDDLNLAGDVLMGLNGADKDEGKKSSAARTLFAIRNTDLFDVFVSQVGNEEAVSKMLDEYLDEEGRPLPPKRERKGIDWRELG